MSRPADAGWRPFARRSSPPRNSEISIESLSMPLVSRRHALKSFASGFGYLAFASLACEAAVKDAESRAAGGLLPKTPHFHARAKRVIFLCMNGGPSHVDLLDYKP